MIKQRFLFPLGVQLFGSLNHSLITKLVVALLSDFPLASLAAGQCVYRQTEGTDWFLRRRDRGGGKLGRCHVSTLWQHIQATKHLDFQRLEVLLLATFQLAPKALVR